MMTIQLLDKKWIPSKFYKISRNSLHLIIKDFSEEPIVFSVNSECRIPFKKIYGDYIGYLLYNKDKTLFIRTLSGVITWIMTLEDFNEYKDKKCKYYSEEVAGNCLLIRRTDTDNKPLKQYCNPKTNFYFIRCPFCEVD